ncbi:MULTISPECIES: hypothetical protein [Paenibacillus]|jgi:hypothetical protein|uniref:hypothetical protein n=1 Tax=Paenibacillus TaxID=44249 RepID=UPI00040CD918|nr:MULTISPECIES: hypothetical protein [Paenibacillus]KEO76723.1 hypothetical protein EL23_21960 [Paenibacillus polymyxa]MCH6190060.1 hypothetical protein [Paenibacillus polymyxa]UMY53396.1 hypothetical protein MLD56_17675 [Paenibacillus peoriae]WRL58639.1 hypothetical protein U3G77_10495 [Paenibacillus polymyxa]
MKNVQILKVFIASPGDVIGERGIVGVVIDQLNKDIGDIFNVRLQLVNWENSTSPSIQGVDAQDIINKQIDDDYDIFIGVLWSRAGTKTARADSGTIEEFERAYNRARSGGNVEVMFYFNESPISPRDMDLDQLKLIKDFKSRIGEEGVYYWSYEGIDSFESFLRAHLTMKLKNWNTNHTSVIVADQQEDFEIEDEDEDGLLDLYTTLTQKAFYLNVNFNSIESLVTEFAKDITLRTEKLAAMENATDIKAMKIAISRIAIIMNSFASKFEPESKEMSTHLNEFLDAFSKSVSIIEEVDGSLATNPELVNMTEEMFSALKGSEKAIDEIKEMLGTIPPIQKDLIKAKKRIMNLFSDMNRLMSTAASVLEDMIS